MNRVAHQLGDIHTALEKLRERPYETSSLQPLQERLREIDSMRVQGKFLGHQGDIPSGQAKLVEQLEECYGMVWEIQNGMRSIIAELNDIKHSMSKMLASDSQPTWTLLAPYQDRLRNVQVRLHDGKYVDEKGEIPAGQAHLIGLLNECYTIKDQIADKIEGQKATM